MLVRISTNDETEDVRYALTQVFKTGNAEFLHACPGKKPCTPFGVDEVKSILRYAFSYEDDRPTWNAEEDLVALLRLEDGLWATIEGGCDTTGWDCVAWLEVRVGETFHDVWNFGLTDTGRRALGVGRTVVLGSGA